MRLPSVRIAPRAYATAPKTESCEPRAEHPTESLDPQHVHPYRIISFTYFSTSCNVYIVPPLDLTAIAFPSPFEC
jgi:hypothetical protein